MNQILLRPRLESVVMPLVRLMSQCDLSWSDRQELSSAIASCTRHWNDMEAERQELEQRNCQQSLGPQTSGNADG
jgi:hypothetical protein